MNSSAKDGVTWLFLVRHGATEANERVPNILQGNAIDLPLSPDGERQARDVAAFLHRFSVRHVYSSGMLRARQTADIIGRELSIAPSVVTALHECDVGVWEGLDWQTIRGRFPEEHRRFVDNPAENPYLGGESYGDVLRRVEPAITDLLDAHPGESIAIVAHNVVNRVYLASLAGIELRRAPRIAQANGGVNLVRRKAGQTELVTLNALFHLSASHSSPPGPGPSALQ
jgi:broad specificity phosphatase PhoE